MYSKHNEGESVVAESLLEPKRIKSTNILFQYREMCILIN